MRMNSVTCGCRESRPSPLPGLSPEQAAGEGLAVALLFLYLEFPRMLQFLRLRRDDRAGVAIEVVMAGHEVSVLVRQVEHLSLLTGSP